MSEIDDIFASKGKTKELPPVPGSSLSVSKQKKKHKKKKSKIDVTEDTPKENAPASKKRPLPETIVDPSIHSNNPKRHRTDPSSLSKRSKSKKDTKEESQFKDSRGDGQRMPPSYYAHFERLIGLTGRRTEEGWTIYKEDELGLGNEGGGRLD